MLCACAPAVPRSVVVIGLDGAGKTTLVELVKDSPGPGVPVSGRGTRKCVCSGWLEGNRHFFLFLFTPCLTVCLARLRPAPPRDCLPSPIGLVVFWIFMCLLGVCPHLPLRPFSRCLPHHAVHVAHRPLALLAGW
jgi:hypothetical protein